MAIVLILTNEEDRTALLVEEEFLKTGVDYIRLNTETFGINFQIEFLARNSIPEVLIRTPDREIFGKDIRSIWFRRPLPPRPTELITDERARQFAAAELKSCLDGALFALDCLWVSHPSAIRTASHKLYQLKAAVECGFTIPRTLVSMDPTRIYDFYKELRAAGKRVIAKVVSPGPPHADTPEEQYSIFTTLLEDDDLRQGLALSCCPAIYQEYVEKKYELRVTVVGERVFACEIHSQATERTRIDWRRYDLPNTPHLPHQPNPSLEAKCIAITKYFGLMFSAIDLIVRPDGEVVFLEMNPNGQWGWIQELTGLPIARAIADLLSGRDY
jgi:hypothetical protein